ncbi:MAG: lipopolysaccharide kinase InaA family protein [Azoarcus sp.]|jgi:tRNA A-37 threonylcarbamoyl transferase component Bud32|nr:lipopolysaccharide kinase InaA family protein [Azoarcus sp.]
MNDWRLLPPYDDGETARAFGSLAAVFALDGEKISCDPQSEVIRLEVGGARYYIKRYRRAGKNPLRRWLVRPRVRAEWENLLAFAAWGIPCATVVAHGLERRAGFFVRGALITRELTGAVDLARLACEDDPRLRSRAWLAAVIPQAARIARTIHAHGFVHNDLKWRNLLVDDTPTLYLIDCPGGEYWLGPFLRYRIVKDLACLDKIARHRLSRAWRLRFFHAYTGEARLTATDKNTIRRILRFFEGRE